MTTDSNEVARHRDLVNRLAALDDAGLEAMAGNDARRLQTLVELIERQQSPLRNPEH